VAAAPGLHRKTVYGWLKKYREGGRGALLARPEPGRLAGRRPLACGSRVLLPRLVSSWLRNAPISGASRSAMSSWMNVRPMLLCSSRVPAVDKSSARLTGRG